MLLARVYAGEWSREELTGSEFVGSKVNDPIATDELFPVPIRPDSIELRGWTRVLWSAALPVYRACHLIRTFSDIHQPFGSNPCLGMSTPRMSCGL